MFLKLCLVFFSINFVLKGVLLVSGALCADAAIGNVQEKQMKLHKASNVEVVFMIFYYYVHDKRIQFIFHTLKGALFLWYWLYICSCW